MAMYIAAAACPRRLFVHQLYSSSITAPLIRLMGTVISTAEPNETTAEQSLVLDDGTGTVRIGLEACHNPTEHVVGRTIDIICRRKDGSEDCLWTADTIVWNVRDVHAESLRGLEIHAKLRDRAETNDKKNNRDEIFQWGYPCRLPTKADVFRLIRTSGDEGASLEDLALVLGLQEEQIQTMVQELQMQGEIYKNREASYVPL